MEEAVQISATDVNSETAHFRILCRQGDYKTRRSHPTEPVGSENRNLWCSLTSGDYKTTAKDIPRARSRFLRSRKRDKQIQMPAKSAGACKTRNLALPRFLRQMAVRQKTRSTDRRRPVQISQCSLKSRAEFLEGHRKTGVTSHMITCYHHPWSNHHPCVTQLCSVG